MLKYEIADLHNTGSLLLYAYGVEMAYTLRLWMFIGLYVQMVRMEIRWA